MTARLVLSAVTLACLATGGSAQPEPPKRESKTENVRQWTSTFSPSRGMTGVVDAIDEKGMTFTDTDASPPKQYSLLPVDLLAQGKRLKDANGSRAYDWTDVKKGDTVVVITAFDDGEQKRYCLTICIERRSGAKLPPSNDPKKDSRYARSSLLNEIENGNDVDEADIAKIFPPRFNPSGAVDNPGGLPGDYRAKLNANRDKLDAEKAKKDKDLKATPPDKK